MPLLPAEWMPSCTMHRVILHWTAGGYRATGLDRFHYHVLVEGPGAATGASAGDFALVRGTHSIRDNANTGDAVYAAHTRGTNTRAIGVAACGMHGAREKPFAAGAFPLLEPQWDRLLAVAAELCRRYAIVVTPETVLGHGEVQANLGRPQLQKWDPMVLPWAPSVSKTEVGRRLRERVRELLAGTAS